jgi:hypothetical protein
MVSKAFAAALTLCLLAPAGSGEFPPPSAAPGALTVTHCGAVEEEVHFGMLGADEEPQLRSAYGLQVCLAVYRVGEPAAR